MQFKVQSFILILFVTFSNSLSAQGDSYKFPLYRIGIKIQKPKNYYLLTQENLKELKEKMISWVDVCFETKFAIDYFINNPNYQVLINEDNLNETIVFIKYPKTADIKELAELIHKQIEENCYSLKDSKIEDLSIDEGTSRIGHYNSLLIKITISDFTYYSEVFIIQTRTSTITVNVNRTEVASNIDFIDSFEHIHNEEYEILLDEIDELQVNEEFTKAKENLLDAINIDPNNVTAYEKRAFVNLKLKNYNEVIADADEVLRIESTNINGYLLKGLAFYNLKKSEEAIECYMDAELYYTLLKTFNAENEYLFSFAYIYSFIGEAYLDLNTANSAIKYFELALELSSDSSHTGSIFYNLGIVYSTLLNNSIKAIEYYTLAINNYPMCDSTKKSEAFYNRGINKRYIDDFEGAISDYDLAIILRPGYLKAYNNRGFAKLSLELYLGAISDFTFVIENDIDKTEFSRVAFGNRGIAKLSLGLNGCHDLKKAIELGSRNLVSIYNKHCE